MDKHFLLASLVGEKNARCLLADHGGRLRDIVLNAAEPSCAYSHPGLIKIRAARQLVQEALLEELSERAVMGSPAQVRDYLRRRWRAARMRSSWSSFWTPSITSWPRRSCSAAP